MEILYYDAYQEILSHYCEINLVEIEIFLSSSGTEKKKILTLEEINLKEAVEDRIYDTDFKNIYILDEYNYDNYGHRLVSYNIENLDEKVVIDKDVHRCTIFDDSRMIYVKYSDSAKSFNYDVGFGRERK